MSFTRSRDHAPALGFALERPPLRVLSGFRHELQITSKRSSWPLVLVGAGLVAAAMGFGA
jgi:hypothetical protein